MIPGRLPTVREAAAVAAVAAHYALHRHPPSLKEVALRLGCRTSQADRLVKAAARLGSLVVVRKTGVRTQIRLAAPPPADAAPSRDTAETVPHQGNDRETNRARLAA